MVQANELRIGNFISSPRGELEIVEIGVKNNDYYATFNGIHEGYYLEVCEPIPLTQELLLKCGAKLREVNCGWEYYDIDGFVISVNVKDKRVFFSAFDRDGEKYVNDFDLELETIHQLQNLYFALSNKELEVNLC